MKFVEPDPRRYRISSDGYFLIEKVVFGDPPETRYVLWKYEVGKGGFESFSEAQEAAYDAEVERFARMSRPSSIETPQTG